MGKGLRWKSAYCIPLWAKVVFLQKMVQSMALLCRHQLMGPYWPGLRTWDTRKPCIKKMKWREINFEGLIALNRILSAHKSTSHARILKKTDGAGDDSSKKCSYFISRPKIRMWKHLFPVQANGWANTRAHTHRLSRIDLFTEAAWRIYCSLNRGSHWQISSLLLGKPIHLLLLVKICATT